MQGQNKPVPAASSRQYYDKDYVRHDDHVTNRSHIIQLGCDDRSRLLKEDE